MRYLKKVFFIFTFLLLSFTLLAQTNEKVIIGDIIRLKSSILNEERVVNIYLPKSYYESTFEYPVLYLLDAEWDFHHTTGTIEFFSGTGKIPELIVVGIVNTNRSRDLTPEAPNDLESQKFWGEIGGAKNFKLFLQKELIPYIDSNYRTVGYNLLRGQSFGGLFGLFDLFTSERIFNAYILSSPSVRWNENTFFNSINQIDFHQYQKTKVYIGDAEFDWSQHNGIKEFSTLWAKGVLDQNNFHYKLYKGEGHSSLVFDATKDGLKFIYQNWNAPDSLLKSSNFEPLKKYYSKLSSEFGYAIKVPMNQVIRMANHQLRNKNYEAGIRIAKKNVEIYPNQPQTYWHVGDAYFLAGRKTEALPYFEKALEKAKALNMSDLENYLQSIEQAKQ
jgi:predicted alpha/beta superfamily hydrolase